MKCPQCNNENRSIAVYCKCCGNLMATVPQHPLESLVGMDAVKDQLQELTETCEKIQLRSRQSHMNIRLPMDMLIIGYTGTGKTKLVHVLQQLLHSIGIVKKPAIKMVDAADYSDFAKDWDKNIQQCKGGILCIENTQKLLSRKSDERNDLDKLLSSKEKWDGDPIVVLSGLAPEFKESLAAHPSVSNRFKYCFDLKDFMLDELTQICLRKLSETYGITIEEKAQKRLEEVFKYELRNRKSDFGNGHLAAQKAGAIFEALTRRDHTAHVATPEDIPGEVFIQKTYEEIMAQLDDFVGIDEIKEKVQQIIHKINFEHQRHPGKPRQVKDHFLFLGNPGTGKTTIARVFADVLNALEVLPIGHLVEVSRKDLVAGYVGQTAALVEKCVDRAMGGVLFIDEAYSLKQNEHDSFGQEAIDTLLKLVEDHRGKFVTIAAGYSKEMHEFLSSNSGMNSRFNETIHFRDYRPQELTEIFRRLVAKEGMRLDPEADTHIGNYFQAMYLTRTADFGNAREVRNAFERAKKNQGIRLQKLSSTAEYTPDMNFVLTRKDIEGEDAGKFKTIDEIIAGMDQEFVGMDSVKEAIRKMAIKLKTDKEKMDRGIAGAEITPVHIVLTGNPGTGKTTVARKLGEIFKAIGLLPSDKVAEKSKEHLISKYSNSTAEMITKACDEAMGGILFIDEAYSLVTTDAGGGQDKAGSEAVTALLKRMEDDRGKFVVICAGYRTEMEEFLGANPGFQRRFTHKLHIDDYTSDQLAEIYKRIAAKKEYQLTPEAATMLSRLLDEMVAAKDERFGNAGEVNKLFAQTLERQSERLNALGSQYLTNEDYLTIDARDIPYDAPLAIDIKESMKELDELIGLDLVKREVQEIAAYIEVERAKSEELGKEFQGIADHYLFVGNPGTGKTTVARIMSQIFHSLGVLPSNRLIEVTRKDLVAGYVGQTAKLTNKMFRQAIGGVFFIDEAYSLKSGGGADFGQEATDTLLPLLLDYKGKMVCIAAGYPREMQEWINSNSGLESRFTRTIHFEDYNGEQLAQIFLKKAAKDKLELSPEGEAAMRSYFNDLYNNRTRNFANAREVNNYFDRVKKNQSSRLRELMRESDFDRSQFRFLVLEDFLI